MAEAHNFIVELLRIEGRSPRLRAGIGVIALTGRAC
jgi:hypothetical protein